MFWSGEKRILWFWSGEKSVARFSQTVRTIRFQMASLLKWLKDVAQCSSLSGKGASQSWKLSLTALNKAECYHGVHKEYLVHTWLPYNTITVQYNIVYSRYHTYNIMHIILVPWIQYPIKTFEISKLLNCFICHGWVRISTVRTALNQDDCFLGQHCVKTKPCLDSAKSLDWDSA